MKTFGTMLPEDMDTIAAEAASNIQAVTWGHTLPNGLRINFTIGRIIPKAVREAIQRENAIAATWGARHPEVTISDLLEVDMTGYIEDEAECSDCGESHPGEHHCGICGDMHPHNAVPYTCHTGDGV